MKPALAVIAFFISLNSIAAPLQTVAEVDLKRYLGRWYEIASYPNYFQRRCEADVMADYSLGNDAKISVINRCLTANNEEIKAKGWAKVVPETGNAKLRVTFLWPFFGDYWVIGLDPQYRYAVVGEPDRENLWILARTPLLEPELLDAALETARAQGYDLSRLRYTKQSQASPAQATNPAANTESSAVSAQPAVSEQGVPQAASESQ